MTTVIVIAVIVNTLAVLYIANAIGEMRRNVFTLTNNTLQLHKDLAEVCQLLDSVDHRLTPDAGMVPDMPM